MLDLLLKGFSHNHRTPGARAFLVRHARRPQEVAAEMDNEVFSHGTSWPWPRSGVHPLGNGAKAPFPGLFSVKPYFLSPGPKTCHSFAGGATFVLSLPLIPEGSLLGWVRSSPCDAEEPWLL